MNIERTDKCQITTPDEGMWLFNEMAEVFCTKIYAPLTLDVTAYWRDVTDEYKREWEKEHQPEEIIEQ